jgi:hypothetical protein
MIPIDNLNGIGVIHLDQVPNPGSAIADKNDLGAFQMS